MADSRASALASLALGSVVILYWVWDPVQRPETPEIVAEPRPAGVESQPPRTTTSTNTERSNTGRTNKTTPSPSNESRAQARGNDRPPQSAPPTNQQPTKPPVSPPQSSPTEPEPARTYTVKPGDSLSRIAQREYGSVRYTDLIFEVNRDLLPSPDALAVGQVLKLPPRPSPSQNADE